MNQISSRKNFVSLKYNGKLKNRRFESQNYTFISFILYFSKEFMIQDLKNVIENIEFPDSLAD